MSPVDYGIWFLFGLIVFWVLGGVALRVGGLLCILIGGFGLVRDPHAGAVQVLALGVLAWLLGHWLYAVRHHEYKSPLARYIFCRWAPSWADPTRHWAAATTPERTEHGEGSDHEG